MAREPRRPDSAFWVEPSEVQGDTLRLSAEESHHLLHVFRASPGTTFEAVDGNGCLYACALEAVERGLVLGRITDRVEGAGEIPGRLELLAGLPDPGAAELLVTRAVPLGVAGITFLTSERSERWRTAGDRGKRLLRVARAALKQCRRTRLPRIRFDELRPGGAGVADPEPGPGGPQLRVLADPCGLSWSEAAASGVSGGVVVAVGPPGGFTAPEKDRFRELGFQSILLGPSRLRTEDAAVLALALAREGILASAAGRH